MKKTGLKIFLFLMGVLVVAFAVLPFFLNPIVQKIIEQKVYPLFGNRLTVAEVSISLFRRMAELKEVALLQPDGFGSGHLLKIASLKGYFSLMPLLNNHLSLRDITITKPVVTLILTRDKKINTDYILPQQPRENAAYTTTDSHSAAVQAHNNLLAAPAVTATAKKIFTVVINQLTIVDGTYIMYDQRIRSRDPTLVIADLKITLKDIAMPHAQAPPSAFALTASLTSPQHTSPITCNGEGRFFTKPLFLNAQSKIDNIDLSDYYYFFPETAIKIQEGKAWVTSKIHINDQYLDSTHHVEVKNLVLTSKDQTLLGKTFLGMPATGLINVLEATNGALDFDFQVKVKLSDLKFKMRDTIISEITKSVTKKIGALAGNALSTPEKIKDYGYKAKDGLKKLFNKFKN